jgi:hypothetical protein
MIGKSMKLQMAYYGKGTGKGMATIVACGKDGIMISDSWSVLGKWSALITA